MTVPKIYARYDVPVSGGVAVMEPSMAHQEFKDECDINRIMARAIRTRQMPVGVGVGQYGDFSEVGSYHEAQETLLRAQAQFAALPSKIRDRFKNDPGAFLSWVADKANFEEARELGLLSEEAVARVPPVVVPQGTVVVEPLSAPPVAPKV